jgi:hypothetical protein
MTSVRHHSFGTPQNRAFPQLNLHRTRVRRNHGRPRPNGFTERAQNSPSPRTPQPKRASGKPLTLVRQLPRSVAVACRAIGRAANQRGSTKR